MTVTRKIALKSGNSAVVWYQYDGLLLVGSGFDAAPSFDVILNLLGFYSVIRDEVS